MCKKTCMTIQFKLKEVIFSMEGSIIQKEKTLYELLREKGTHFFQIKTKSKYTLNAELEGERTGSGPTLFKFLFLVTFFFKRKLPF